ncbi:MAG: hypothetical protein CMI02_12415 [Oceanospirillaceae bacterium]|nr:hypothetical protein [Oceanospirillaceae bacterium]MBT12824.1 hypothetical protein [Oceanospirillaceae bacterium]|tara:strand:+ start:130212 stop:130778 length:567 start_codon:yes stop_codon:yes gene_type:complete
MQTSAAQRYAALTETRLGNLLACWQTLPESGADQLLRVSFIDDAESAAAITFALWPDSQFKRASADHKVVRALASCIQNPAQTQAVLAAQRLSYEQPGSDFQQRVWQALTHIPAGHTWSYKQLADHIGCARGARAVASACAANQLAVIIPCHRVVNARGGLAGYRWGVERKQALLAQEQAILSGGVNA